MRGAITIIILGILFSLSFASAVKINEFTVDPQSDWDGSGGNATSSDEWIELYNEGSNVNLTGWRIEMKDGTNETEILDGILSEGDFFVLLNPVGLMNNDGQILLYDSLNNLVDSVSYGNWDDGNSSDNAPDGNADDVSNECLARVSDGEDSDVDSADFIKTSCTYDYSNTGTPENTGSQGLNVTIGGVVVLEILPTTIEFGNVLSGSVNNPALNGPITFDASGSNTNVNVEVLSVTGFPFETGLKLDSNSPVGQFWDLICNLNGNACNFDLVEVVPTLDIPSGALGGTQSGTIEYMITGTPI